MLILTDNNDKLLGRALLWEFDGYKIMDRIYSICDEEYVFKFKKWATENNYLYKSEQNWYNTLYFENLETDKKEIKLSVKLDNFIFDDYPYLDTFKFINLNNGIISNYIPEYKHKSLTSPDGYVLDSGYIKFDEIDRVLRYDDDCVYVEYLNIYTSYNNVNYSNINNCYILHKDSIYNLKLKDYIFNSENNKYNSERLLKIENELLIEQC